MLRDPVQRQGYDSTVLEFDDAIPPPRCETEFYSTFSPVFMRNLRFDARLREGGSTVAPPTLGDDDTPISQVHAFYDYWARFSSWRDFSTQASVELQVPELEMAESRLEKRYWQKEIDKRSKQLKRQEMARIQTLVERAMEADPRLYVGDVGLHCIDGLN